MIRKSAKRLFIYGIYLFLYYSSYGITDNRMAGADTVYFLFIYIFLSLLFYLKSPFQELLSSFPGELLPLLLVKDCGLPHC